MDYLKLTKDLREANQVAMEVAEKSDDGGSANLDSVFLMIPRVREERVLGAIKTAGLYCRGKRKWIGQGYMITPTTGGQGNKRSLGVGAMYKHLKSAGWDVITYCQMD
jgi:hypothetical protein